MDKQARSDSETAYGLRRLLRPGLALSFATSLLAIGIGDVEAQEDIGGDTEEPPREAQSAEYALWLAYGYSDNIRREADAQTGNYASVGVELDLLRERERLSTGVSANLQFRSYSLDELENEQIGNVDANAEIDLIPRRFSWAFYDSFGQGRTDPFAAAGPLNRQNVNYFSTGPTLDIPLGRRTELSLSGLFQDYRHEDTEEFNSQTLTYEAGLLRQIGPVSRIGIIAESEEVEYEGNFQTYTIRGAVLHYERAFATGDVVAEFGRNELVVNDSVERGPRALLAWRRALTSKSRLGISFSSEFTDAGAFFAFSATESLVGDRSEVLLTPSPLEQKRMEVFYEFSTDKTLFVAGFSASEETFSSDASLNNESTIARLSFTRRLSARSSITAMAEDVQRDFQDSVGEAGDRLLSLAFDYRLSRLFVVQFGASSYDRRGAQFFDERRYEIRLRLDPFR